MSKFEDILCRWQDRRLTCAQAGLILGISERTFRRYCRRYEEVGLEGLFDGRLGRKAARAVPVDEINWMLDQYQTHYIGWTVKHFHDHLVKNHNFHWSYTWTKLQLHKAGLVTPAPHKGKHRRALSVARKYSWGASVHAAPVSACCCIRMAPLTIGWGMAVKLI